MARTTIESAASTTPSVSTAMFIGGWSKIGSTVAVVAAPPVSTPPKPWPATAKANSESRPSSRLALGDLTQRALAYLGPADGVRRDLSGFTARGAIFPAFTARGAMFLVFTAFRPRVIAYAPPASARKMATVAITFEMRAGSQEATHAEPSLSRL